MLFSFEVARVGRAQGGDVAGAAATLGGPVAACSLCLEEGSVGGRAGDQSRSCTGGCPLVVSFGTGSGLPSGRVAMFS